MPPPTLPRLRGCGLAAPVLGESNGFTRRQMANVPGERVLDSWLCSNGVTRQQQAARGCQLRLTSSSSWRLSFLIWKSELSAASYKVSAGVGGAEAAIPALCQALALAVPSTWNALPDPLPPGAPRPPGPAVASGEGASRGCPSAPAQPRGREASCPPQTQLPLAWQQPQPQHSLNERYLAVETDTSSLSAWKPASPAGCRGRPPSSCWSPGPHRAA